MAERVVDVDLVGLGVGIHPEIHRSLKAQASASGQRLVDRVHDALALAIGRTDLVGVRPRIARPAKSRVSSR